jgi:nucleoside-diphosphate-sugar epimerase
MVFIVRGTCINLLISCKINAFKLKHAINWEPKIHLREGIDQTIDWFIKNYGVNI